MPTVAEIAAYAFDGVASAIPDAVHTATLNGAAAGRVVQDNKAAPGSFPALSAKDGILTIYCEGFTPAAGDTVAYNGVSHLVFWVHDIAAAGGLIKATVFPTATWLSETVTFKRNTKTSNGRGGFTETPATVTSVSALVRALSGSEAMASDRVEAKAGWRIICEHFTGLTEADWAEIDGRRHNIRFIDDVEKRGLWLQIDVEAGAAT